MCEDFFLGFSYYFPVHKSIISQIHRFQSSGHHDFPLITLKKVAIFTVNFCGDEYVCEIYCGFFFLEKLDAIYYLKKKIFGFPVAANIT